MRQFFVLLFLTIITSTSCNQKKSDSVNTLEAIEECIKSQPSKNRQIFASVSLQSEKLDWYQSICEQDRLWMAVYQHKDINRGNILIRTKNANGKEESFFTLHFSDYKLAKGTYKIDPDAFSRIEFDDLSDDVGKVVYGGKDLKDGQLEVIDRDEKMMKARFTGTIPELKLKENRKEVIYTNVKVEFSFYIHKPFKFKH